MIQTETQIHYFPILFPEYEISLSIWIDYAPGTQAYYNVIYVGEDKTDATYLTGLFISGYSRKVEIWSMMDGYKRMVHQVDLVMKTWIPIKMKQIKENF